MAGSRKLSSSNRMPLQVLQLLLLDRRFAALLAVLALALAGACVLPLKIWRQSPEGVVPEVRVSAIDLIQTRMLRRSAEQAELRSDKAGALQSWKRSFQNNPCDPKSLRGYTRALLETGEARPAEQALRLAMYALHLRSNSVPDLEIFCLAAEKNFTWPLLIQECARRQATSDAIARAQVKAHFFGGNFQEAERRLAATEPAPGMEIYRAALDLILGNEEKKAQASSRFEALRQDLSQREETLRVLLTAAAGTGDLEAFARELTQLKQISSRTLRFDLLHARLLLDHGFRKRAIDASADWPAPATGEELFMASELLARMSQREDAKALLAGRISDFREDYRPWLAYARILIADDDRGALGTMAAQLEENPAPGPFGILASVAQIHLAPRETLARKIQAQFQLLEHPDSDLLNFAVDTLAEADFEGEALALLLKAEASHLSDDAFYTRVFNLAAAVKDDGLMRRAAERRYELAPLNWVARSNYAAMLVLRDEKPELAVSLTESCLNTKPKFATAQINHAAALISAGLFGSADLLMAEVDEASLSEPERDQLQFLKVKRLALLGRPDEARQLAGGLPKKHLLAPQVELLSNL